MILIEQSMSWRGRANKSAWWILVMAAVVEQAFWIANGFTILFFPIKTKKSAFFSFFPWLPYVLILHYVRTTVIIWFLYPVILFSLHNTFIHPHFPTIATFFFLSHFYFLPPHSSLYSHIRHPSTIPSNSTSHRHIFYLVGNTLPPKWLGLLPTVFFRNNLPRPPSAIPQFLIGHHTLIITSITYFTPFHS